MVANEEAWMKLGQVVQGAQTAADTMREANLLFTVSKHQQKHLFTGEPIDSFHIYRDDTGEWLANVGAQHTLIQNDFQFNFCDALMEADGQAHYTAAGALGKGERVWCQIDLGLTTEIVPGDTAKTKLTFVNSHDGSMSAKAFMTSTRVVCQNTMNYAMSKAKDALVVRHTKNAENRINQARSIFTGARQTAESLQEKLRILAGRKLVHNDRREILNRLFFAKKTEEQIEKDTRGQNLVAEILERFEYNDGNAFPQIADTPYALLNAIIEHTDHFRNVRRTDAKSGWNPDAIRANNALFGAGADLKTEALQVIMEATANAPSVARPVYSIPSAPIAPMPPPTSTPNLDAILAGIN
jgi:phage/plasmid-like protein (TIGR03299 family)